MFRKMFAALLALALMLCCVPAMAESAEYIRYVHPDRAYSLEYPSDYIVRYAAAGNNDLNLAGENQAEITIVIESAEGDYIVDIGLIDLDNEFSPTDAWDPTEYGYDTDQLAQMTETLDIVTFDQIDGENRVEVSMFDGGESYLNDMLKQYTEYSEMFLSRGYLFLDIGSIRQYGGNTYVRLAMRIDREFDESYIMVKEDKVYCLTFISCEEIPAKAKEHMLSTFTVLEK